MPSLHHYNPAIHHRRSYRLHGWNYSKPGYYFITVCTHDRHHIFGSIDTSGMYLNEFGNIVQEEWDASFEIRSELEPDAFVIMPNHIHAIVRVIDAGEIAPPLNPQIVRTSGRTSPQDSPPLIASQKSPPLIAGQPAPKINTGKKNPRICPKSISSFMAGVKSAITKRINALSFTPGAPVWQSRFHDHIIRDENELYHIRNYIKNNPAKWLLEKGQSGKGNHMHGNSPSLGDELWMI